MKNSKFLAIGLVALSVAFFSSCEKENLPRANRSIVDNPVEDPEVESDKPKAGLVNLAVLEESDIDLVINGKVIAERLGLGQQIPGLDLTKGTVKLDLLNNSGNIVASSTLNLLPGELYNIYILAGADGITPKISVLKIDLLSSLPIDGLTKNLGFLGSASDLFSLNVLDLTKGLPTDNLLMGVDFINSANKLVPGLLALQKGVPSGEIIGNNNLLGSLNLLNSTSTLTDLLSGLTSKNGSISFLNLGDVIGLGGLPTNTGILTGLLNTVQNLLGSLLGGGTNPLTLLQGDLLNNKQLLPGHQYTMLLTGSKNNPLTTIIDQTNLLKK